VAPGASIAHELHAGGIPWVIASQFPLSFAGSAVMAEVLYERLLRGDDLRCVLHDLRQRLSTECSGTHDWAALVAYAAMGDNFEREWAQFGHKQTHRAIDARSTRWTACLTVAMRRRPRRTSSGRCWPESTGTRGDTRPPPRARRLAVTPTCAVKPSA
jgi:hypothetical protein